MRSERIHIDFTVTVLYRSIHKTILKYTERMEVKWQFLPLKFMAKFLYYELWVFFKIIFMLYNKVCVLSDSYSNKQKRGKSWRQHNT